MIRYASAVRLAAAPRVTPRKSGLTSGPVAALFALLLLVHANAQAQLVQEPPISSPEHFEASETGTWSERPVEAETATGDALDASAELAQIDGQIWELRHEARREHVVGPLLLVVAGYGMALVGTAAALATFSYAEDVQQRDPGARWRARLDVNNDGRIDRDDEQAFRAMARSFAVASGVGWTIGIVGSVLLAKGLRAYGADMRDIRSLKQRRRELLRQLDYSGNIAPGGLALSLRGRF